jgi:serine-type D-Ala-D-Ala carboxypeptidase (penicillin-binding protein 5/6)
LIRFLCALLTIFLSLPAFAADSPRFEIHAPPPVDARSVIVIDMANGDVLFEHDADVVIPPASLTKIMSMMVALDAVDAGKVALDTRIPILWDDVHLPYRSSLMYLREGMRVPFDDLLRGMAVVSGNDAARTVARVVAGSPDRFVDMMNAEAARLGLSSTHFVEPSGLSELNATTAREMAILARVYMLRHPAALESYHARTSMEFPRADVMPPGETLPAIRIVLRSTNGLLFGYEGCDGLKTGYIDESGYNLVATAERKGTRVISVTLGGVGGPAGREKAGATMLDWAFSQWRTVHPWTPELPLVRTWGGANRQVELGYASNPTFTVPSSLAASIQARIEVEPETEAPVSKGTRLGRVVYTSGDRVVRRIDVVAVRDVPLGNIFVRARDAVIRFFSHLFRKA